MPARPTITDPKSNRIAWSPRKGAKKNAKTHELGSIDDLKGAPYNPRMMTPAAAKGLRAGIEDFGDLGGITWNKRSGLLVSGHQRVEQLRKLGAKFTVDAEGTALVVKTDAGDHRFPIRVVDWDESKAKAALVVANSHATQGTFTDSLGALLKEIQPDLGALKFDALKLDVLAMDFLVPAKQVEEDAIPAPPPRSKVITKVGDVWELGPHRLVCGNCRDGKDWERLERATGREKFEVVVTSPPYAAQREYDEDSEFEPIPPEEYAQWFFAVQDGIRLHLAERGSFFLNIKEHCEDGQRHWYVDELRREFRVSWGWRYVDKYIWTHGGTPKAVRGRFKNGFEEIFWYTREPQPHFYPENVMKKSGRDVEWFGTGLHPNAEAIQKHGFTGGMKKAGVDVRAARKQQAARRRRTTSDKPPIGMGDEQGTTKGGTGDYKSTDGLAYPSNVLSLGKNHEAVGHSAAFPVALPAFFLRANAQEGEHCVDVFMGSGSSIIAGEQTGRIVHGFEISPAYCDVIVKRWEKFTGKKATRQPAK